MVEEGKHAEHNNAIKMNKGKPNTASVTHTVRGCGGRMHLARACMPFPMLIDFQHLAQFELGDYIKLICCVTNVLPH